MAYLCNNTKERALVLIDEFGKGTAPQGKSFRLYSLVDGIALFLALLRHIHDQAPESSYFLLSTHFSDYLKPSTCSSTLNTRSAS